MEGLSLERKTELKNQLVKGLNLESVAKFRKNPAVDFNKFYEMGELPFSSSRFLASVSVDKILQKEVEERENLDALKDCKLSIEYKILTHPRYFLSFYIFFIFESVCLFCLLNFLSGSQIRCDFFTRKKAFQRPYFDSRRR